MSARRHAVILSLMATTADTFLRLIQDINRESDDSENDDLLYLYEAKFKYKRRKKVVRINGYINNVIPRYNTQQFRQHFRIIPTTFETLLNKLAPMLSSIGSTGRPVTSPRIQLLAVLWLLATPDSYR